MLSCEKSPATRSMRLRPVLLGEKGEELRQVALVRTHRMGGRVFVQGEMFEKFLEPFFHLSAGPPAPRLAAFTRLSLRSGRYVCGCKSRDSIHSARSERARADRRSFLSAFFFGTLGPPGSRTSGGTIPKVMLVG